MRAEENYEYKEESSNCQASAVCVRINARIFNRRERERENPLVQAGAERIMRMGESLSVCCAFVGHEDQP